MDLGSHYPIKIEEPQETKSMKLLWVESKVKELEAKILGLRRQLEGADLLKQQFVEQLERLKNSTDV